MNLIFVYSHTGPNECFECSFLADVERWTDQLNANPAPATMKKKERAPRCAETIDKKGEGMRYVYDRHQCKNRTRHPSGYCHLHVPPKWRKA